MSQQPSKTTRARPTLPERGSDLWGRARTLWSEELRPCSICKKIPFTDGLQSGARTSDSLHSTDLRHILQERNCPVCHLLLECLKQPENDIFAAAHIKDHLKSSPELKNLDTFNKWLLWFSKLSLTERFQSGEDVWPFGSTRDAEDAEHIKETARALFLDAEDQDVHAGGAESAMMSSQDAINDAMHAAALTMGVVKVADPRLGGRQLAGAQLAANEFMAWTKHAKAKLPCYIAIRLYGNNEDKCGAISVRVYACGRAPRAAVKEACHFTLRARDLSELRVRDGQLWYGRVLQPEIDFGLFKKCLITCKEQPSHQTSCGRRPPTVRGRAQTSWVFRLVDVVNQKIVETDFEAFCAPGSKYSYAALSYVWGHAAPDLDELVFSTDTKTLLKRPGSLAHARIATAIRDAMEVVKKMDQTYLWVDRLCVIQKSRGSPLTEAEQKELSHTIENMGRIYSHALFTIIDGNSEGSKRGLFRTGQERDTSHQIIQQITPEISVFLPTSMPSDLTRWESRAWTFQEKVLSRRMLVFSNGFAQWQCQEGVWREDVNARDVNTAALAISHSYLTAAKSPPKSEEEQYGLRRAEMDGSMRLYRTPAFSQYAQCVHDYTSRTIKESSEVLRAFTGILNILGSKTLLDTEFLYGLPHRFIDSALLWHTQFDIRRRSGVAPPSWSWAGWELQCSSLNSKPGPIPLAPKESEGPCVFYRTPFNIHFDTDGMKMLLTTNGEERMRPLAKIYTTPTRDVPLPQLGLLGTPWTGSQDWDYNSIRDLPASQFLEISDRGLTDGSISNGNVSDKHLVICTEMATLYLGTKYSEVRKYTPTMEAIYPDFQADIERAGDDKARERWLYLDPSLQQEIGVAARYTWPPKRSNDVQAILLSEAQYLGNESRPDVLGYPLYNIMLVEEVGGGVMERIGLERVRKNAWRKAGCRSRTVILG